MSTYYGECGGRRHSGSTRPRNSLSYYSGRRGTVKTCKQLVKEQADKANGYAPMGPLIKASKKVYSDGQDVQLSKEQKEEIRAIFKIYDANNDGSISKEEMCCVMKNIGFSPSDEEVDELVIALDLNQDGLIDYHEFELAMAAWWYRIESKEEELLGAFQAFDKNGDGYITAQELRYIAQSRGDSMSKHEARQMIAFADRDKDGRVSFRDFLTTMKALYNK